MEVKASGSTTVNELFSQVQSERVHRHQTQGSVDTSSRKAEAVSHEASRSLKAEELTDKLEAINKLLDPQYKTIKFERHEKLDRTIVRVVDSGTEEVIKEIPPEKFLDMISSMLEFAGIIIDEKI
ncbi:flagellar protein FlaG [Evansella caseinilytica]|uniref:Flagellar protein FlaG n=1 Tax=Evansella caseinilytica TaxID=1503961 RepID=A0A1H3S881_9BACI|nr:flagellar protein FlaG [Evansella caseinilytica]SDZ33761.1 flagellar protein FlaG [Evansella caseinilytica]